MSIARRVIDTDRVKVTLYRNLVGIKLGVGVSRKGDFDGLQDETLIIVFSGLSRAVELVIE